LFQLQNGAIAAGRNQNSAVAADVVSLRLPCQDCHISFVVY
jgi:hypothetical protein